LQIQPGHSHGQLKSARTCTAWINVQDAIALVTSRLVGVAAHNHLKSGRSGIQIQRAQIVQHVGSNDITLAGIHTGPATEDEITLTAHLLMDGHTPAKLEHLVAELSLQPGIRAVHWYAGEHAQSD